MSDPDPVVPDKQTVVDTINIRITGLPFMDSFTSSEGTVVGRDAVELTTEDAATVQAEAQNVGVILEEVPKE